MSTAVVSQNSALWSFEATDEDLTNSGQLVVASTMYVYQVEVDNTLNTTTGATAYVKVYDDNSSSSVTVGTSVPMAIFPAPASTKITYTFPHGVGAKFTNGIVWACVTGAGTAGTTGPTNDVTARMMYSAS